MEWEGFEMAVTMEMILDFTKALMLGRLDILRSLAVHGKLLNAVQKCNEWRSVSINSTTDPSMKLSFSTCSEIHC